MRSEGGHLPLTGHEEVERKTASYTFRGIGGGYFFGHEGTAPTEDG